MNHRPAPPRPQLPRTNPFARAIRWLVGVALLLGAIYVAVWSLGDRDLAAPTVIGVAALMVLIWLAVAWRRFGRRRTLTRLIAGTPTEFEETVADILRQQGFRGVRRTGGAGDLTADVVATDRAGRSIVIQCKRYQPGKPVGSKEIQTFIGMQRIHHRADYGLYVTTSTYTHPARALAERHEITLIDGDDLTEVLSGSGRSWMRR